MRFGESVSILVLTAVAGSAQAQTVNTAPANANVLNLLAPFLSLNGTAIGQQTLQLNLSRTIAINNGASPARQQLAVSDRTEPSSGSITTILANGQVLTVGIAGSLAGGLPLQAPFSGSSVQPYQPVGGLGPVLGPIYQAGIRASTATTGPLSDTFGLLRSALALNIGGSSAGEELLRQRRGRQPERDARQLRRRARRDVRRLRPADL